ncbi:MAG: methionyl-tRNA formyltransferase [Pseudomonadota bacterium]
MRIGFAGTPDFSVPTLDALYGWCDDQDANVVAVWTQPDRPAGRGRKLTASPVKRLAKSHATPVHQPRSLRDDNALAELQAARLDLLVVVAYGLILPEAVLQSPAFGCVNVHASLLPRWRGAAPIQRAIEAGDRVTGVGIMAMDAGLDTGALWRNVPVPIHADDSSAALHDRLSKRGAEELILTLPDIFSGAEPTQQDAALVTYAAKIAKSEADLDFRGHASALADRIRAFNPWPVAQTMHDGRQLRVWNAESVDAGSDGQPGEVLSVHDGILVACGRGALRLLTVQPAGKRAMAAGDFARDRLAPGTILGRTAP